MVLASSCQKPNEQRMFIFYHREYQKVIEMIYQQMNNKTYIFFWRAHTRELESNRIFPKLKPSLTLENMGLSGGYAGEGMYRLTALGAIETSWQQLL